MTPRQVQFVKEYLADLNATQAYVRAGYASRTANKNAMRLMSHPEVRKLIDAAMADRAVAIRVTAVSQIAGLTAAARAELLSARSELNAIGKKLRIAADMAARAERLAAPPKTEIKTEISPPAPAGDAPPPAPEPYRPILPRTAALPDWEAPQVVTFADAGQSSYATTPYEADPLGFLANR